MLRYYVQPELMEVERIRSEQAVVSDAISNAREVIRLRDELLTRYNSIDPAAIEKIRKFLPAGSAISDLFIDIDIMAAQSGIRITGISFSENEEAPTAVSEAEKALSISLKVEGDYDQFRVFLGMLERNLRLIDVVGISLEQTGDAPMGFEIELRSYYQERTIL